MFMYLPFQFGLKNSFLENYRYFSQHFMSERVVASDIFHKNRVHCLERGVKFVFI